ncbi:bifunctional biotin--[acetyl-CoA-carboxylase] ligase/biotin operon repressor BirA [Vibrio agarivorans]|uniref:bifunctional biotin--[acetyl-CoA-carboxylase] ligase/biotin operon repressor BirA n=1 Tax=Vibrio agarivorans TaxID=153622 RepID=UPI0022304EEE|nr:bifunctional biotin--[acetyl-CoA-carboxylase] ligase/biotin operon repressor BirA [Vibrio agarivorans]
MIPRTPKAKLDILRLLAQGGFHSGEEIGKTLGISRAAVSKHIKGIQEWGVEVFSLQGKGYQLAEPMTLLDAERIASDTHVPVMLHPVIDSTNQYLLNQVDSLESGTTCIAEYQSQGRGRRGRQWVSPFGANLYLSMYWRLEAGMAAAMGLSLVVGVAVVEALESVGVADVKLKWPNDLYYQDKKLAGILVELSGQAGGAAHLVIGMGMNIAMSEQIPGIDQPWVSLKQVIEPHDEHSLRLIQGDVDRNQLCVAFINAWQSALQDYEALGMHGFVERWNRVDNFLNRPIKLMMGQREISGISRGINEQGAVLIETEQGVEAHIGGEISLRGL